ncbi:MAG: fused MFS/spermidine synthase, partial [Planctomycetota bacterium]
LTIHLIFFLSGVAGLGYQMAFVRMFAVGLGHELPAVLAVVGAFFGGLALGAWALDRPIARSQHPGPWYLGLEVVIGLWGMLCVWLVTPANDLALWLMGEQPGMVWQWLVSLGLPLVVLLPATAAMGATLPAMERFTAPLARGGRCVGGLYAVNTLGAVLGTLAGAFVLAPMLGYRTTVMALAGVDLLCAAMMLPLLRGSFTPQPSVEKAKDQNTSDAVAPAVTTLKRPHLLALLGATGLLGIGYEIVGLRVIAQVIENTVYSYAAALAVFLTGTALGAAAYQRWGRRFAFDTLLGYLLVGLATTGVAGGLGLAYSREIYQACRLSMGDGLWAVALSEMAVAAAVFLLPTLLMGATFSHLAEAAKGRGGGSTASEDAKGGGLGVAVAINTAGGFAAPLLIGVVMMPLLGTKWTLVAVSLGYLGLIANPGKVAWPVLLLPLGVLLVLPENLRLVRTFEGQRVIHYDEGVMASVAVIDDRQGHRFLRVNNRYQMGGTSPSSARMALRQGHIPLLLHPDPQRALFVGVGTGLTALAVADHPELQADAIELLPEVVKVLPAFRVQDQSVVDATNVAVHTADARRFVRTTDQTYDVIIADLFHPARDGGGMLYTLEHFRAIQDRLAPGGLFVQWLPMYQLDEPTTRAIIQTFLEVFPDARAVMHDVELNYPAVGLVGVRDDWPSYDQGYLARRVTSPALKGELADLGLSNDESLLGMLITGPSGLASYANAGAINTDDRPVVVYQAPQFAARRGTTSYGRLQAILDQTEVESPPWAIQDHAFATTLTRIMARRDEAIRQAIQKDSASP